MLACERTPPGIPLVPATAPPAGAWGGQQINKVAPILAALHWLWKSNTSGGWGLISVVLFVSSIERTRSARDESRRAIKRPNRQIVVSLPFVASASRRSDGRSRDHVMSSQARRPARPSARPRACFCPTARDRALQQAAGATSCCLNNNDNHLCHSRARMLKWKLESPSFAPVRSALLCGRPSVHTLARSLDRSLSGRN